MINRQNALSLMAFDTRGTLGSCLPISYISKVLELMLMWQPYL